MKEMTKSQWVAGENTVHLTMPFTKVDAETRTVSGFATLDNVDKQGDVVLADASRKAFTKFRGNIREMHDKIAAGRLVDFNEQEFYDAESDQWYSGIYVTAYVSKGAPNTWEKCLDGTLTGFSIGGNIIESQPEWKKDAGRTVKIIKDYELYELSLVDNPANQFANIFSITKSDDGMIMKGMVTDVEVVNIFWCDEHKVAKKSEAANAVCDFCNSEMETIGWFEGGEDATEKVSEAIRKRLETDADEGGVNMPEEKETAEVVEETPAETEEVEEAPVDEVVAEEDTAAPVDETEDAEPDFEKMVDSLKAVVQESVEQNRVTVKALEDRIEKSLVQKDEIEAVKNKIDGLEETVKSLKVDSENVTKALKALSSGNGLKKSLDIEDEVETKTEEGIWKGALSLSRL